MIVRLLKLFRQPSPYGEMQELLELMVKAGRRCAYDLDHASGEIRDRELEAFFHERAIHWLSVFNPATDGKSYRTRLGIKIDSLQTQVERLERLCRENGINPDDPDGIPF